MTDSINETHDPAVGSWVESANQEDCDFPIQNLPLGVFRVPGDGGGASCGIAVGEEIFAPGRHADLFSGNGRPAAEACRAPVLNELMGLGPEAWSALRRQAFELLQRGSGHEGSVGPGLVAIADAELLLPARIGNFTDFYASVFHATNAGKLFRPDNPLLPNYKHIPVAYHGRASSIRPSGVAVRRPKGQILAAGSGSDPDYLACRQLDYEAELGLFVGQPSDLGRPVEIKEVSGFAFGLCLLNDWSARDIQAWEAQPLGPFLGKSFATTVSPWVVSFEALAPFRTAATSRPPGDPAPLPHLMDPVDQNSGGFAIDIEVRLLTAAMRNAGEPPERLSHASFAKTYWTLAQMLAHHTSNGCNLEIGDLIGTGTISEDAPGTWGSMLELTSRGASPITLANGETRSFLEDGDEVILSARAERDGFRSIGLGEARAVVTPAVD